MNITKIIKHKIIKDRPQGFIVAPSILDQPTLPSSKQLSIVKKTNQILL